MRGMRGYAWETNKSRFESYSVRNSVLIISHIIFRDYWVHIFSDNLSWNSCINRHDLCPTTPPPTPPPPSSSLTNSTIEITETCRGGGIKGEVGGVRVEVTQIKQEKVTCRGINNFSNKTNIINLEIIIFYQKVQKRWGCPEYQVYCRAVSPCLSLSLLLSPPPSAPEMIRWGRVWRNIIREL